MNIAKKFVRIVGITLCLLGLYCYIKPEVSADFLDVTEEQMDLYTMILVGLGVFDLFIMPRIFDKRLKDKK